jgi:uncharacterized NAD(P)/FAD-binding protein YdhS
LSLEAAGFAGRIVALSRRGLVPRAHGLREPSCAPREDLPPYCVAMLRRVRARSAEIGWRAAVYELRNVTQDLWGAASLEERRRFLRHLRPWWDVHRHKLAPAVGAAIAAMQAVGRLSTAAGRLLSAAAESDRAVVRFRARGGDAVETLRAARIVNCTGPDADIARAGEPLLAALLGAGRIRADPLRLGIFWESVAIPDIRAQAAQVAALIAG